MRIVFCGSGFFAVTTLARLCETGHNIVRVFTNPDRPSGRGGHMHPTPVKDKALELGLSLYQPQTLKGEEPLSVLQDAEPDLAIVVAYGHLIPKSMLDIPAKGFINLHASLLPKYRGAAPVPHAILQGESKTGVTVFRLNERFDEGAILAMSETEITTEDTSQTVLERLAPVGAELVQTVIGELHAGWVQPLVQNDAEASKAPKLEKESGHIHWASPTAYIERMTRAFQPWPLAHTFAHTGKGPVRLVVLKAERAPKPQTPVVPGTIVYANGKEGLIVVTGDGALWLRHVKPAGKREMSGAEYVRGARIEPGMRMG